MPKRYSGEVDVHNSQGKRLKSGPSMVHSFVRFLNCTARRVDVVWLNHEGVGIKYRTLGPNQWVDVNTYVGHPWIFRDSATGDKLVVQLKEVFEPSSWKNDDENAVPQRKTFNITIPGKSTTLGAKSRQLTALFTKLRYLLYLLPPPGMTFGGCSHIHSS